MLMAMARGACGRFVGVAVVGGCAALLAGGCGGQAASAPVAGSTRAAKPVRSQSQPAPAMSAAQAASTKPSPPAPRVTAPGSVGSAWKLVASVGGQPAAWLAQHEGVTFMRLDQQAVHLDLHVGSGEPGGEGWGRYGDRIGPAEVHKVVAGFNGGFRLNYGAVGLMANGRVAVPLSSGLGSIVTYADGATQIGAWRAGVPQRGRRIVSVRQNLRLLVDHGVPAASAESCGSACWGTTLGGGSEVARSALGIDGEGRLVWAAGERLSPAALAQALVSAGVQRAVELDINPEWVAGYLYLHRFGGPVAEPLVPGQSGIPGQLLAPYDRDFFAVVANR